MALRQAIYSLEIGALAEDAEGGFHHPLTGHPLHVWGALEGKGVLVSFDLDGRARLEALFRPSEHRTRPICSPAAERGGCTLQHQTQTASLAWSWFCIAHALKQAGFRHSFLGQPT